RPDGELLRHPEEGAGPPPELPDPGRGEGERVRVHRGVLQPGPAALGPGVQVPGRVRTDRMTLISVSVFRGEVHLFPCVPLEEHPGRLPASLDRLPLVPDDDRLDLGVHEPAVDLTRVLEQFVLGEELPEVDSCVDEGLPLGESPLLSTGLIMSYPQGDLYHLLSVI